MNKRYNDLQRQGYQYVGISDRDRDLVDMKLGKYRQMGNKVAIVTKTEVSPRRGRPDEKWTTLVGLVKFSEEYRAWQQAERDRMNKEARERALRNMADQCSLEELAFMLTYKTTKKIEETQT